MNIKPRVVRGLLRLYPAQWRAEYGEELEALLLIGRITPHVVADVVLSAIRERVRRQREWKTGGAILLALTCAGIVVNNTKPLSPSGYGWYVCLWDFVVFLTGFLTVLRNPKASASVAGAKAALLGYLPEIAALSCWAAGVFHPLVTKAAGAHSLVESRLALFGISVPNALNPGFAVIPFAIAFVSVESLVIGGLGGMLGRAILFLSPRLRPRR